MPGFGRHWRGDLPLAVSFWLTGPAVLTVLWLAGTVFHSLVTEYYAALRPVTWVWALYGLVAGALALLAWQLGGTLHSAQRAAKDKAAGGQDPFWPRMVIVWVVSLSLAVAWAFAKAIVPMLLFTLASGAPWGGDAYLPHAVRVVDGGRAVEFTGAMGLGAAADLRAALATAPEVRLVKLEDDAGGYLIEAEALRDLVHRYRLATYTDARCYSACAYVFVAGSRRAIGPNGSLAFHGSGGPEDGRPTANPHEQQEMIADGVAADFTARAFGTPHSQLWFPDRTILRAANVVTDGVERMSE